LTAAVIDDHLVVGLLTGRPVPTDGVLHTTFAWWWRVASALRRGRGGTLSGPVLDLGPGHREAVSAAVDRLPEVVTVLDPRELLPVMADLHSRFGLNLLAAEAAATALLLDGELIVSVEMTRLKEAAAELGLGYRMVGG
jgi:hypothetical protein